MRCRVRFPVLPWEFSHIQEDLHSDHGLGSLYNLGVRPLLVLHAHTYHHSHHRGNVTASYRLPKLGSQLHFVTTRRGTTKCVWTCDGIRKKSNHYDIQNRYYVRFYLGAKHGLFGDKNIIRISVQLDVIILF
jgi:hypothetical protein